MTVTFYKDKWSEENLRKLDLNERQIKAVLYVTENGKITNNAYRELIKDISRITATRDLTNLVEKGILKMVGIGKRQVHYIMNDSK
jgi:ATP-dependent DNA helicase RecG